MVGGETHREHFTIGAERQANHDLALRKRPADLPACRGIPEPDQSVEIARGQHLAVGLEGQGRDIVGVRHRRVSQPARACVPESHLACHTTVRMASAREASAVGTDCDTTDLPAGVVRRGPSQGASRREIG